MGGETSRDVLEQQPSSRRRALPQWIRRLAIVVAGVAGVALIATSDPLSGEPPARTPGQSVPEVTRTHRGPSAPAIIARHGSDIVRYGPLGASRLARTPSGFPRDGRLWAVDDAGYPAVLYGVSDRTLFRIDPARGDLVADVGPAERIIDVGPGPGELVVQVAGRSRPRVVVLDAATGHVIDRDPFPGFDGSGGWRPRGVMSTFGVPGLVLTRVSANDRVEVAIAWAQHGVAARLVPRLLQKFGPAGRLLGLADDWVLFLADDCPSATCTLTVLSFTRDAAGMRSVRPPSGWTFTPAMIGGDSHEVLVPVRRVADEHVHGLARLVPGGDSALLLRASIGLDPSAGLVAEPDGTVYFQRAERTGSRVLARWSPADPPHIVTFPNLPPLPASARLVCVCD